MKILLKLNKLLISKLEKFELDKKKLFLLIFASFIILCIDLSFIMKSQLKDIRSVRERTIKINKDIDDLNKDLATLQNLKHQQASGKKVQEKTLKAKKIIPEAEMPLLLEDISDLANKYKVRIMQIKPYKDAKAKEEIIDGKAFLPISITLDLSCGYHSLGSFINELENAQFFIAVQDLKIIRSPNDYLSQEADIVLKTYVKK